MRPQSIQYWFNDDNFSASSHSEILLKLIATAMWTVYNERWADGADSRYAIHMCSRIACLRYKTGLNISIVHILVCMIIFHFICICVSKHYIFLLIPLPVDRYYKYILHIQFNFKLKKTHESWFKKANFKRVRNLSFLSDWQWLIIKSWFEFNWFRVDMHWNGGLTWIHGFDKINK